MEPTIVEKGQLLLVGFGFYGDPFAIGAGWTEENEIGRLWSRFMAYWSQHRERVKHVTTEQVMYELHVEHEETDQKGEFEVFAGVEVAKLEDLPVELSVKMLPPATYAVFTLHGQQITSDWPQLIYSEWLPQSGYQLAHDYGFQLYDERFKGLDQLDDSALDVYVPVKPAHGDA